MSRKARLKEKWSRLKLDMEEGMNLFHVSYVIPESQKWERSKLGVKKI